MYLLFLDESGTHTSSPVRILSGLALHEQDAWYMQRALNEVLARSLPTGLDPLDFELHASEIKSPTQGRRGRVSPWAQVPIGSRFDVLQATYRALVRYQCRDGSFPCALFGAVVDAGYGDAQQRGYEEVLHKFDEMLTRQGMASGVHQRGLVIHDKQIIEPVVQAWTSTWRQSGGRIGTLTHLADVPLFADSRASRLIQASDFVCWALWRFYGMAPSDERWIRDLWSRFDRARPDGQMDGLIHVTRGFRTGSCLCPPCSSRRGPIP